MKKIKILFYSHTIDYAGTWRSHERILLNLDKNIFDVYVFFNPNKDNNRLSYLKTKLNENKIIPFYASVEKNGGDLGYSYKENNFVEVCNKYNFDIIHFARGGWYEWPFTQRICPIQIETNIFGSRDNSDYLDCSVAICDVISKVRGGSDYTVYNPIPLPYDDKNNLLKEFKIPKEYFVFGRIGRPDNFDPISLDVLYKFKQTRNDFVYIVIGACNSFKNKVNEMGLNDVCIILNTTNDDYFIHKFYNSLDLFLHYRSDGECHSTAISQSMIYGVPVLSHEAGLNGQIETIGNGGFVAKNTEQYLYYLNMITNKVDVYDMIAKNAKIISKNYELESVVKKWESIYKKLYNNKKGI